MPKKVIHAFKGFNTDLTCRGFQYKEGETYEQEAPAEVCRTGFHAVTSPLDVFGYYPPAESVYHAVELSDVSAEKNGDSKVAGRKIKIGAALSNPLLVNAHIEFVMSNVKKDSKPGEHATTDRSAASSTGDRSAASSTGYRSAASSTGEESIAAVFGYDSKAQGALNNWIVLTERDTRWHIIEVKAFKVDGKIVLADTFYKLVGGKAVKA